MSVVAQSSSEIRSPSVILTRQSDTLSRRSDTLSRRSDTLSRPSVILSRQNVILSRQRVILRLSKDGHAIIVPAFRYVYGGKRPCCQAHPSRASG